MNDLRAGALTYYYLPIVNGVVLSIADWQKALKRLYGTQTTIFTPRLPGADYRDPDVVAYPAVPLVRRVGITIPLFPQHLLSRHISARGIQLLHVHHPFFIGSLALALGQRHRLPVVFTYHTRYSQYAKTYLPFVPGSWIERVTNQSLTAFMNRASAVTVSLPGLAKELLAQGVSTPISVIPVGIDTRRFAGGVRSRVRARLGLTDADCLLLSVGRIAKEKNVAFLLDSFIALTKRGARTSLCFVGTGPEEQWLMKKAKQLGLTDTVHVLAPASYNDMPDYYAAGDIFVYASQTETFGRVYVEAMAAGLPVVALTAPAIGDVIGSGTTGIIVREAHHEAYAQAVGSLVASAALRRSLGEAGKRRARERFDIEVSASMLHNLYVSML